MEKKIEQVSEVDKQFEELVASYEKLPLIGGIEAVKSYLKDMIRFAPLDPCVNCVHSRANKETDTAPPFSGGLDIFDRICSLGLEKDTCDEQIPIVSTRRKRR